MDEMNFDMSPDSLNCPSSHLKTTLLSAHMSVFKHKPVLVPVFKQPELRSWGDDRHESWLELFYDLIYVAVVFQLGDFIVATTHSEHFHYGVDAVGLVGVFLIYYIIYDTWMQHTLYTNLFYDSSLAHLAFYGFETVCFAYLALFLHVHEEEPVEPPCFDLCGAGTVCVEDLCQVANHTFGNEPSGGGDSGHGNAHSSLMTPDNFKYFTIAVGMAHLGYAVAYALTAYYLRQGRQTIAISAVAEFTQAIIFFGAVAVVDEQDYLFAFWGCGVVVKIMLANLSNKTRRKEGVTYHTRHLISRYGILMMISLGESILQITIAEKSVDGSWYKAAAGISTMIVFMLAFAYFHTQPHDVKEHVASRDWCPAQTAWFALHPFLSFSYICVGIGTEQIFESLSITSKGLDEIDKWLYCIGVCCSLCLTAIIRLLHKGICGGASIRRQIMYIWRFGAGFSVLLVPLIFNHWLEDKGISFFILNGIAIGGFCITDIGRDVSHHHTHDEHGDDDAHDAHGDYEAGTLASSEHPTDAHGSLAPLAPDGHMRRTVLHSDAVHRTSNINSNSQERKVTQDGVAEMAFAASVGKSQSSLNSH